MSEELKKGCVVFMKESSGLCGYGNAQCVSDVHGPELGTISLYGHNQHYKTYDIDKVVFYPVEAINAELLAVCKTLLGVQANLQEIADMRAAIAKATE